MKLSKKRTSPRPTQTHPKKNPYHSHKIERAANVRREKASLIAVGKRGHHKLRKSEGEQPPSHENPMCWIRVKILLT